jgi:Ca2+-binding RTX toxin-like protein
MALIKGTDDDDHLDGTSSSDRIFGFAGNDFITSFGGADLIYCGEGNDRVVGVSGSSTIYGQAGDDNIEGGGGSDFIYGGGHNDTLWGADGYDEIYGDGGNDIITDSAGGDYLDGGNGVDTLVISHLSFSGTGPDIAFVFDPANPITTESGGTAVNFEQINFTGGNGNDHITGGNRNDTLRGWNGNDQLFGGKGDDFVIGDNGDDEIHGGSGDDLLTGNGGSDTIYGDAGDDTLIGGRFSDVFSGHDVLEGGAGADQFFGGRGQTDISFVNARSGVDVNMVLRVGTRGDALGDTYDGSVAGAILGSSFGDNIIGGLYQHGNGGNDVLVAGPSTRTMTGGDGHDTFGFVFDTTVINDTPTVTDFDQSLREKIDLSAMDPKSAPGDDAFRFIGTAEFIEAEDRPGNLRSGQVRYEVIGDQTFIQMTLDGRGGYDATIILDGVHTLTAHDFIL